MKLYYKTENGQLYHGKCEEVLSHISANSIDTIITDPPYGLNFMGKKWDYDVPSIKIWQECLRVLKPGGTALIFAGSRTQHRMACNVEDAGFILKDTLLWIYGSGFPKATDISKQLDNGHKRKVVGYHNYTNQDIRGNAYDSERAKERPRLKAEITVPITPEAHLWNGWKSHGLKPSYEPILVCMKPNEGSYAQNALTWGVAGLNIDGGRIVYPKNDRLLKGGTYGGNRKSGEGSSIFGTGGKAVLYGDLPQGRYPANIILDEEAGRILDEQSGNLKSGDLNGSKRTQKTCYGKPSQEPLYYKGNQGGASRFFFCAKASKSERNAGCHTIEPNKRDHARSHGQAGTDNPYNRGAQKITNSHPTVKPLKLMEYLCTLTETPTKGTVLDPFAGSGSTLLACEKLGRKWIGIEMEEEYCEIAAKRIEQEASQLKLFR